MFHEHNYSDNVLSNRNFTLAPNNQSQKVLIPHLEHRIFILTGKMVVM